MTAPNRQISAVALVAASVGALEVSRRALASHRHSASPLPRPARAPANSSTAPVKADSVEREPGGQAGTPDGDSVRGQIGGVIGTGPFDKGLHQTPPVLWLSVVLILLCACLVGGFAVAISLDRFVARALLGAAVPVGFLGVFLAMRNHIMSDVD